jgi:hypothetical protein
MKKRYSHPVFSQHTTGAGIEYSVFQLDVSYLLPISASRSPLANTIRFSLLFNFHSAKKALPLPTKKARNEVCCSTHCASH